MECNPVLLNNLPLQDGCQHRVCPLQACIDLHKSILMGEERKKESFYFKTSTEIKIV